ncbi:hypothetical protein B0A49_12942, partial [Cryomyces minteri]
MARPSALQAMSELRNPTSSSAQITALKQLKNDIVGHDQRKEQAIKNGIVPLLVRILSSSAKANGKRRSGELNGNAGEASRRQSWTTDDELRLQATFIVGSLAQVEGSNYRAARFLYSPPILNVFPEPKHQGASNGFSSFLDGQTDAAGYTTAVDLLLPRLQSPVQKSVSFSQSFPALGSLNQTSNQPSDYSGLDSSDSPVCTWLIHLARKEQGLTRLAAIQLLAATCPVVEQPPALSNKIRERRVAFLVVPLLAKMLEDTISEKTSSPNNDALYEEEREVDARTPTVLASLIRDNPTLQKAAVDAGAIKKLCQILKRSFDPLPPSTSIWSPTSSSSTGTASSSLGTSPALAHAMKCREGALEGLAAIADKEDAYRKTIVDNGVVSCVIDALEPYAPSDGSDASYQQSTSASISKGGNPVPVLLAACHAARSMSRSVSVLRTSLIDAGIARPIFALLKHPKVEVQVAATDVLCNLLLEFSPMRQGLIDAGALQTLCEHAHSSNHRLRHISLWALKHLVYTAPQDMKRACLEELSTGWLIKILSGEQHDGAQGATPIGMGTPNAAGEQVDLLNSSTEPPAKDFEDFLDEDDEEDDGDTMTDDMGALYKPSCLRSTLYLHKARLKAIRNAEQNADLKARRDDVEIQEQALDYIRNLINGENNSDMLDYILDTLGADRIFGILHSKLKTDVAYPSTRNNGMGIPTYGSQQASPRALTQPVEIVLSAVHCIVHVAGGKPRHRQLLISQKELIRAWLPHFNHSDRRVRV